MLSYSSDPGVFNNGDGEVVAMYVPCCFDVIIFKRADQLSSSYDYETFTPVSKNGAGGLAFIGMQRCLDCDSSPISQLATRQRQQGWASKSVISFCFETSHAGFDVLLHR